MIVDSRSLQTLIHMKERKEEISDIKFSPGKHFKVLLCGNIPSLFLRYCSMKSGFRLLFFNF